MVDPNGRPEWSTRKPQTTIRNLESRIRNPDIMSDDRDNSLQQCLINKYRKILFCWPAKICSGDLYQYQCENSVDLELLSYLLEKRTNLFRRARLYRGYHWRRPCSLWHFLSFSVSATHKDQIHTSGKLQTTY